MCNTVDLAAVNIFITFTVERNAFHTRQED